MKIQTTKVYAEIDKAVKSGYKVISEQGSSRSSKTYNTLIWLIVYLLHNPNKRLSIVRGTLPAIKGSVFIDFKEILINIGVYDQKNLNKTEMIYTFPNGSWVEFFSTDDEQKLRGRKRNILYVNEANEIPYIAWQQLMMRTTDFAIIDYNPSFSDDHWICSVNSDKRTYHFISTYKDNPFLEQNIIDEIESLQWKNKALWEIYGLGKQSLIEGLIFPNVTIIDEFPDYAKKQALGMDFGYSSDPTAIIKCGVIDDNIYLDEVCYKTHMLTKDIIEVLKPLKMKVISESADPRLIQEISNAGIWIYPVQKSKGSVLAGILKMQEMKIHITKRSVNLLKERRNYTYMQNKDGVYVNEPIDAFNHAWDATRYYVWGEILGKIMQIKPISKDDLGVF